LKIKTAYNKTFALGGVSCSGGYLLQLLPSRLLGVFSQSDAIGYSLTLILYANQWQETIK